MLCNNRLPINLGMPQWIKPLIVAIFHGADIAHGGGAEIYGYEEKGDCG